MVTGISFAIFLLSFVLGVIGGSLHLFLLLTISLTVASLSFILTALTIDKNSKQIKKPFRGRPMTVFRVVMLFLGAGCLLISSLYLMDVPTYVSGDYQKVEGVPSNIKHSKQHVQIQGEVLMSQFRITHFS
ncbi:hypothetical protein GLW05_13590 [Pontibacillus yanchengensis]|uniref:Uncharacterized protein n=1 Tax=Pontibacillus yanchengensis TaxID=462910 RepID=A0A6I5A006_9BACI|nr:hypothetical protein [Pontibacillus yanchengensis]MYL34626.1 hypothetical protein [Pontibacillus yanchengensis]